MKDNPETAAKSLLASGFPVEQYEQVQQHRYERMKLWKERGIQVLIEQEQELIDFGEEVLKIMRGNTP